MGKAARRKRERRARPLPERVARAAGNVLVPEFFTADCCINATWVVVEVLRRHGVIATSHTCATTIFNPTMIKLAEREGPCTSAEQSRRWQAAGARMLDIDLNSTRDGKFAGHVIGIADGYLIDASSGQFDRPHKQIDMPKAFASPIDRAALDRFVAGDISLNAVINGSLVVYRILHEPDHKSAPGWGPSPHNLRAADAVERAMRR